MPGRPASFIASPLKIEPDANNNVRSMLNNLAGPLAAPANEPTQDEKLVFWNHMAVWSAQNLAAIEGRGHGAGASGR
jgi:hypothetical protein